MSGYEEAQAIARDLEHHREGIVKAQSEIIERWPASIVVDELTSAIAEIDQAILVLNEEFAE